MAEDPVTYEDLTEELKKKYDDIKALFEADLIGSFQRTRTHGIRWKGFSAEGALDGVDLSTPSEERTSQYAMEVDTHPFPAVNMVECTYPGRCQPGFSFSINMVEPVYHPGKDKDESSRSRGKEKEEAVPRDRPRHDDKRYITEEEVRNVRYQRPLSEHLLNKYERQYDQRRRYNDDDERDRRSGVDNRKYRRYDRNDERYERRAKEKSREQDDVDRHWDCTFFKHCWDSGMSRLPTIGNCPNVDRGRGTQLTRPSLVVQLYDGIEKVAFYLSRRMLDAETRYPEIEKLCLCLFFTCTKLRHIFLTAEVVIICKLDVVKHMLSAPVLKGRLGKWMFVLSEFDLQPTKAVKGQALADLISERINTDIAALSVRAWAMFFNGSACDDGCGIGILLVSPRGATYSFFIRLSTPCTNNIAEYEAIRKGMELLLEAGAEAVELFGDSKLVISQLTEEYKCESESLFPLWMQCRELMTQFRYINFNWVPRSQNTEANDLAQMTSGYKEIPDGSDVQVQFLDQDDWRADIFNYWKDPARGAPKRIRYKAMKYVLIGDAMFYRTLEGLLLKCLGPTESNRLLHEVHEGACGTHQSAHKMKWLIRRSGFYWPTMLEDCFRYYKGCQACQMFGKIQMVPASAMNPIIKPWPFRGWGMDMIGKIHPASSKGHEWILAITDYFTKWVEAVSMKKVKSEDVINFVKEHVIHRFGIPQTITTDGGSVFISKEFIKFCDDMGIKLIRSSPYYAQANGQAEASNQSLIKLIKRKVDEHPRRWHENDLTSEEYAALMSDSIEDLTELRLWSLEKIKENKAKVARAYNKKVRPKEFQVGDLVWEAVLPLGTKDKAYGKWSPNWHGPYRVDQVLKDNAYMLEQLDGVKFPVAVNGQHLKKYFPSMWDDGQ
ncbi:hypothetical protein QYE76_043278 [Lolium multiflorum]|uniref:Uncharacterized protein n=1 Tax=Lolium multiflorum TaxID=4521 RepID=A0AAD8TGB4_LOLMU|nr:hypothetical protein QYE76_043278 [Lolium multiflorum]